MRCITQEKSDQILILFRQGKSNIQIQRELGLSWPTIYRKLVEAGEVELKKKDPYIYKYKFRDDLSDREWGYVLGLLASDGTLEFNSYNVRLDLQIKDEQVVRNFSSLVTGLDICKVYGQTCTFKAALPELYKAANSIGITYSKTKTLNVDLSDKTEEFRRYFLRGVIDGDGTVYITDWLSRCKISICSASRIFLEGLSRYFNGNIYTVRQKSGNDLFYLSWEGSIGKELSKLLPLEGYMMGRKTEKLWALANKLGGRII